MKRVILLILALCLMASLSNAAKSEARSITATQPIGQPVQSATVTTELPVYAINLLYDEGYLTKEERDVLLYSDYSTLMDGERNQILSALRALGRRLMNSPWLKRTVKEAFHLLTYYVLENCDGGGSSGGPSPCPGPPYNPYMEQ